MTISILAFDEKTGAYGGAAATGSLCVGGWVLRGDAESGLSASQGSLPSTFWGTDVLAAMKDGQSAEAAVRAVTERDSGRDERQLSALDLQGRTACFTGAASIASAGCRTSRHVIVAGNLLASEKVLEACLDAYCASEGSPGSRLLAALDAAAEAGGDSRGFQSAALLVVRRDAAPLTLRIDHSSRPLADLRHLHQRATSGSYAQWASLVPTLDDPERATPYFEDSGTPV